MWMYFFYLTCPLGLTSNTSFDLCSPFSKDSSLCLYPCSFFSSSTIMTLQQGGDPAPHSRVIVLDMDLAQNGTTQNKKWCQWWVNRRSFYDTFSIQRLRGQDTPSCSGPWNVKQRRTTPLSLLTQCLFIAEYEYTAFQVKVYSTTEIFLRFCWIVKRVLQTSSIHLSHSFCFCFFRFYYNSNTLFALFSANYFTHFYRNYKNKTSGEPHNSCTL